jgi:hypothetical protein
VTFTGSVRDGASNPYRPGDPLRPWPPGHLPVHIASFFWFFLMETLSPSSTKDCVLLNQHTLGHRGGTSLMDKRSRRFQRNRQGRGVSCSDFQRRRKGANGERVRRLCLAGMTEGYLYGASVAGLSGRPRWSRSSSAGWAPLRPWEPTQSPELSPLALGQST